MKIIGQIPARLGSVRVKHKNLRDLNGKPMIAYSIEAAKNAKKLSEFYVNTESDEIGQVVKKIGAQFYKRPSELATDTATQDQFNLDFIQKTKPDVLVLVNPVCPLIEGSDIDHCIDYFLKNKLNTAITCKNEHLHSFCQDKPINFNPNEMLPKTQDIPPIQICTWCVAVWDAHSFASSYKNNGYAAFHGKVGLIPLPAVKSIKVSTEEDFQMAEFLLKLKNK